MQRPPTMPGLIVNGSSTTKRGRQKYEAASSTIQGVTSFAGAVFLPCRDDGPGTRGRGQCGGSSFSGRGSHMAKKGYIFWDSETANPQQRICQVAYILTDSEETAWATRFAG